MKKLYFMITQNEISFSYFRHSFLIAIAVTSLVFFQMVIFSGYFYNLDRALNPDPGPEPWTWTRTLDRDLKNLDSEKPGP